MFVRARPVQVCNSRFFPGVAQNRKVDNLNLRFRDTRIQLADPQAGIQGLGKDGLVIVTASRNNRVVLVQRDTPLAPAVLQLFKVRLVRIRQVDAVTHEVDVRIERTILVDIFGIVGAFAGVIFRTVDSDRRVTVVVQVLVKVIECDISRRSRFRRIPNRTLATRNTAVPHKAFFFVPGLLVKSLIVKRRCRTQVVFAIVVTVRLMTANGNVFTHLAQVEEQGAHVTTGNDLDILHLAHILVVGAVRAHHATPRITHQVVVRTERHLEYGQVLVVHIGVADVRIDVLV